jgi:hypothetical protein
MWEKLPGLPLGATNCVMAFDWHTAQDQLSRRESRRHQNSQYTAYSGGLTLLLEAQCNVGSTCEPYLGLTTLHFLYLKNGIIVCIK